MIDSPIASPAAPTAGAKKPAMFFDRDGVVIEMVDYLSRIDQVALVPGVGTAIADLNRAGIPVVIVTNQSGIARGLLTEADLRGIHTHLTALLAREGARVDAIYYCPHHPDIGDARYRRRCECRKPAPGMLVQAARDLGLDLARSAFIGDHATDLEAGRRAGIGHSILVLTGHGKAAAERLAESELRPASVCPDVVSAIETAKRLMRLPV
jgi:D-glycero-D-manno-heptose 1,7-bisphosphate phosphatase